MLQVKGLDKYIILLSLFYCNERDANELICIFKLFENKMIYVKPFHLKHKLN